MVASDQFTVELKEARLAEAAQLEAMLNFSDARALRLENLLHAFQDKWAGSAYARSLFQLTIEPGVKPRLWIDLVSSVVMEPDPRSYRLVKDEQAGITTIFETSNMPEMASYLSRYLAHRLVEREKAGSAVNSPGPIVAQPYNIRDMFYVWIAGCVFGAMALFSVAMYLGKLQF